MSAPLTDLDLLLAHLSPRLVPGAFVFCALPGVAPELLAALEPVALFREDEGWSAVVEAGRAAAADLPGEGPFSWIVLDVLSSLEAVGLTAAVAGALARQGIAVNVVAALRHDHCFVPSGRVDDALACLRALSRGSDAGMVG